MQPAPRHDLDAGVGGISQPHFGQQTQRRLVDLLDVAVAQRPVAAAGHAGAHRAQVIGQRTGALGPAGVASGGTSGYNRGIGHAVTPWRRGKDYRSFHDALEADVNRLVSFTQMKDGTREDYLLLDQSEREFAKTAAGALCWAHCAIWTIPSKAMRSPGWGTRCRPPPARGATVPMTIWSSAP